MSRSKYSDETKAAVMAALLTGQSISSVAKEYAIPKGTVSDWAKVARTLATVGAETTQKNEGDGPNIGALVLNYLAKNLESLAKQVEVFGDREWLQKQAASELAVLHGVQTDKAIRLIEALNRAEPESEPA
jgi:transposase-like protein